jgi:hypothetical protein
MARRFEPVERNVLELTVILKHANSFMSVYCLTKFITLKIDGN